MRIQGRRGAKLWRHVRNRGTQAFWAMHVEAKNWSGMNRRVVITARATVALLLISIFAMAIARYV
jgi:hypothetical protein